MNLSCFPRLAPSRTYARSLYFPSTAATASSRNGLGTQLKRVGTVSDGSGRWLSQRPNGGDRCSSATRDEVGHGQFDGAVLGTPSCQHAPHCDAGRIAHDCETAPTRNHGGADAGGDWIPPTPLTTTREDISSNGSRHQSAIARPHEPHRRADPAGSRADGDAPR